MEKDELQLAFERFLVLPQAEQIKGISDGQSHRQKQEWAWGD